MQPPHTVARDHCRPRIDAAAVRETMHHRMDIKESAHMAVPVQELYDGEERLPMVLVRHGLRVWLVIGRDFEEGPFLPDTRYMAVPYNPVAMPRLESQRTVTCMQQERCDYCHLSDGKR